MKLRSMCTCVAGCCCILGLMAILWTLIIQESENRNDAIQPPEERKGRLRRGLWREVDVVHSKHSKSISNSNVGSSFKNYGWKKSFGNDDLLYKVHRTISTFSNWIRGDGWPAPGIEADGTSQDTGSHEVKDQLRTLRQQERRGSENMHIPLEGRRKLRDATNLSGTRPEDAVRRHRHRTRKDTTRNRFRTMELASKGDTQYINLITPNPEIEITIDVVGEEGDQGEWETMEEGASPGGVPSSPSDEGGGQDQNPGGPDSSEDGWLNVMRPTDVDNDPPRITTHWGQWTSCSTTCGGGKKERARYCGVNCIARETQDCNRMSCPPPASPTRPPRSVNTTGQSSADVLSDVLRILDPNDFRTDSCSAWMSCRNEKLVSHLSRLSELPGCPCEQPRHLHRNDAIFDAEKEMVFRWAVMSVDQDWLDIYKPTATHCIQSLLSPTSTGLAAQQCCYGRSGRLITRGPGAGTPNLISSEISPELNYKVDIMPWIICKGDWTKYNRIRPPNNALDCPVSPGDDDYRQYWLEAKEY